MHASWETAWHQGREPAPGRGSYPCLCCRSSSGKHNDGHFHVSLRFFLGFLKAIAVSCKDPSGDVYLSPHAGSCITYLAAGRRCQPALHCSLRWLGLGGGRQHHLVLPQQQPTAACSSSWSQACGSGSKVSRSSRPASLLGELPKTAWSLLHYRGNVSFGRQRWFQKRLLFLLVHGILCYPSIRISCFPHDVLEGLFCRCL